MKEAIYTLGALLAKLSPIATVAIYKDGGDHYIELAKEKTIKLIRSNEDDIKKLLSREIRHIGVNEINKNSKNITVEVFVY